MFGSKLRAWMEAVRPKKKQHRKDKQGKNPAVNERPNTSNHHTVTWKSSCLLNNERKEPNSSQDKYTKTQSTSNESKVSRYSANNLSSPESAYSTGYSTDGTSPGGAPPDYLINSSDKKITESTLINRLKPERNAQLPCTSRTFQQFPERVAPPMTPQVKLKSRVTVEEKETVVMATPAVFFGKPPETASGVVSPRQRNRIRTNPWLPGGSTSNVASPVPARQEVRITPLAYRKIRNSPIQYRYLSPVLHRRSLSSSSCSSISAGPNHSFEHRFPRSLSDEDDCTLNEMMGKYDESYVYEKETDILSDSDPTDCESDIDTGQDGGDEEDNGDEELDFIDNGSYIEIDNKTDNTGHCMYFIPSDMQRKRSSRRRATRRSKEASDRRRRSSSNKKLLKQMSDRPRHSSLHQDGSKSAGATPVSVRRSNLRRSSVQLKVNDDLCNKRRSNSVCLQRDVNVLIEKRDREAELKYKELIGQAEQIIRTMNVNGLSPRRVPGPTNKRVELLRFTECVKPEVLFTGKPSEEAPTPNSNIPPSTVTFKNTRFSPKKNHITNFIINNSPVLVRKENQKQSPVAIRRPLIPSESNINHQSPLSVRRQSQQNDEHSYGVLIPKKDGVNSPAGPRRNNKIKSILHKNEPTAALLSPRHRRESECPIGSSSSEEETLQIPKKKLSKSCPQSEPMRRKVYFGRNTINIPKGHHGKVVAFNLTQENLEPKVLSSENLRHQVLLNTIQSLKRNLEDHSASLQQAFHHPNPKNTFNY